MKEYFNNTIAYDFFRTMAGDQIGEGQDRLVFNCRVNADLVIKVETGAGAFQNVMEWEVWKVAQHDEFARKWFAPCQIISPCGTVLLMEKTTPLPHNKYPEKLPKFITDTKYANFGLLNGKFVWHDYGVHMLFEYGFTKRMIKANWWEE